MLSCFSHVQFLATLWTEVHQAPLSMEFYQARILEMVAISFSRDLPNPGIEPVSPALAGGLFTTESHEKPCSWRAEPSQLLIEAS